MTIGFIGGGNRVHGENAKTWLPQVTDKLDSIRLYRLHPI